MGVTVTDILAGPMDVYEAPVGTVEPTEADNLNTVILNAAWRNCGGTSGGLKVVTAQKFGQVEADQTVDIIASLPNTRMVTVEMSLLEMTLKNIKMTNNGGTITTGANTDKYEPITNTVSTPPDYRAILCKGVSSVNGKPSIAILRKLLVTSDVSSEFKKDGASMLAVTYQTHYVSAAIGPFAYLQGH